MVGFVAQIGSSINRKVVGSRKSLGLPNRWVNPTTTIALPVDDRAGQASTGIVGQSHVEFVLSHPFNSWYVARVAKTHVENGVPALTSEKALGGSLGTPRINGEGVDFCNDIERSTLPRAP